MPYRGGAPAVAATVSGETPLTFANYSDAVGYMKSGRLRALAITSARRFPQSPELPTIAEAGLPGYEVEGWTGLLAPAGTSREVSAKLAGIVQQGVKNPDVRRRMLEIGAVPGGNSPEEFRAFVQSEMQKWGNFVKQTGIKVDQ